MPWRAPRAARWTFAALVAVAGATYAVVGRGQWFYGDDWSAIITRGDAGTAAWPDPHQQHWMTLPTIVYQLLWNTVGLHSYHPYRGITIGAHLVACSLLWLVVRRSGVSPWTATIVLLPLLFTGVGSEVTMWAILLAFSGSLAFGLGHLLVADHDGTSWARGVAAAACGTAALMCSGVGLVVLGVSALALLGRRGWRWTAAVTAPPLVAYAAWYLRWGSAAEKTGSDAGDVVAFATRVVAVAVRGAAGGAVLGAGLVVLAVAGTVVGALAARRAGRPLVGELAIPLAFATGAVGFAFLNGMARAGRYGVEYAERGRFAYVALALLVPAIAYGLDAIAGRGTLAAIAVWALLVVGTVSGLDEIKIRTTTGIPPKLVLAVANSPSLDGADPARVPFPDAFGVGQISAGWLQQAHEDGRIPAWQASPADAAEATALLALVTGPANPTLTRCTPLTDPVELTLEAGRPVLLRGPVQVQVVGEGGARSKVHDVGSFEGSTLTTTDATTEVVLQGAPVLYPAEVCR